MLQGSYKVQGSWRDREKYDYPGFSNELLHVNKPVVMSSAHTKKKNSLWIIQNNAAPVHWY